MGNLHEVTATFVLLLMTQFEALNRPSANNAYNVFKDEDFVFLDLLPPATVKNKGTHEDGGHVVVRASYLKLNLKRNYQGELESMPRYEHIAHEALLANIAMYYLEFLPAFALPGLAQSHTSQVDWEVVALAYSAASGSSVKNQILKQVLNPFKVKQMVRNAVAVTGVLSRVLADRSKLQGIQRGLVQVVRAVHHAAKKAIADL